jgi:hypothetical protein
MKSQPKLVFGRPWCWWLVAGWVVGVAGQSFVAVVLGFYVWELGYGDMFIQGMWWWFFWMVVLVGVVEFVRMVVVVFVVFLAWLVAV